jgi:hypothetical protein
MRYLKNRFALAAVWAALLLTTLGTAADKDVDAAEDLNQAIVSANNKIYRVGRVFGDDLAPAFKEKDVDLDDLRKDYKRIKAVLAIVQKDMKEVKVPNSKLAREYYKAHQAFLKVQEKFVKKEFADILKTLEDENLTAADKKKKIEAISKQMDKTEKKVFTELEKAQKAFAKAYGIKIK